MEQNYEYWEREKVAARQKDLKVLVDTLCRSMKEKGITEYIFGKPMCIKKCGRDMGSYIQVDKLFLKENGRGIDMQYILCDYIADNPIVRRCKTGYNFKYRVLDRKAYYRRIDRRFCKGLYGRSAGIRG